MFEKRYIVDPGSFQCLFYSVSDQKLAAVRTCAAYHDDELMATGTETFRYIYKDASFRVRYPIQAGRINGELMPILKAGFDALKAGTSLMPSTCIVVQPAWMDDSFKQKLETDLKALRMKKIMFIDTARLYQSDLTDCVIHVGHNYTEMHLYIDDEVLSSVINLGADTINEQIKRKVASKTRCIISDEDALALCNGASEAFWSSRNRKLACLGLNRYQKFSEIETPASDLWEPIETVEKQIILWVKTNLKKAGQKDVLSKGIRLSGGLARLFGLRQMLEQELNCKVYCNDKPEEDPLMNARVMK